MTDTTATEKATTESGPVGYGVEESVAYITLRRPRVLNALNHETRTEIIGLLERANGDDGVRAVVLRGEGRAFCAGQDQKESAAMDAEQADQRIADYGKLFQAVRETVKPTVAQIHGYAAGAGLQMALYCDLRIAAESAKVGMTELAVGSACVTGSSALNFATSMTVTKELILNAEFITAARAQELNLVTEVCADGELAERVREVALVQATRPALAVKLTKDWWRSMTQEDFDASVVSAHRYHAENHASGNLGAAARSFVNKTRSDA